MEILGYGEGLLNTLAVIVKTEHVLCSRVADVSIEHPLVLKQVEIMAVSSSALLV